MPHGEFTFPRNAYHPGLTKREWYAAQALIAMGTWAPDIDSAIESGSPEWHNERQKQRAEYAFLQADAMIKASQNE